MSSPVSLPPRAVRATLAALVLAALALALAGCPVFTRGSHASGAGGAAEHGGE